MLCTLLTIDLINILLNGYDLNEVMVLRVIVLKIEKNIMTFLALVWG